MATYEHIINRAMSRAGVKTAEIALEASEVQTGLDLLNDMLEAWEAVSPMGFTASLDINDNVRIPRYANGAVIDNLAVMICPEFQKPVPQSLAISAENLKNKMLVALQPSIDVDYPSTLPLGSGNYYHDANIDRRYFPEDSADNF